MRSYEEYLDKAKGIATLDDLNTLFMEKMRTFGYDLMMLCLAPDKMLNPVSNFPQEWIKYYLEKEYYLRDPGVAFRRTTNKPFHWHEIVTNMELTPKQLDGIRAAAEAGLTAGISVPMDGIYGPCHISLASTGKPPQPSEKDMEIISALCHHYYDVFYKLSLPDLKLKPENVFLSSRQIEVMVLVVGGKTDNDISCLLAISANNVDTHMRAIFQKLGVNNRVSAAVRALQLNLIKA